MKKNLIVQVLFAAVLIAMPLAAKSDTASAQKMGSHCLSEVRDVATFFEEWFTGKIVQNQTNFRLKGVLTKDFSIVRPDGIELGQQSTLRGFYNLYGTQPSLTQIHDDNIRFLQLNSNVCVLAYDEFQVSGTSSKKLVTTAVLVYDESAPNKVKWQRVQETNSAPSLIPSGYATVAGASECTMNIYRQLICPQKTCTLNIYRQMVCTY